jgi:hypothetical protein
LQLEPPETVAFAESIVLPKFEARDVREVVAYFGAWLAKSLDGSFNSFPLDPLDFSGNQSPPLVQGKAFRPRL